MKSPFQGALKPSDLKQDTGITQKLGDLGSQQEMRRLLKAGRPIGERESTSLVLILI